MKSKLPSPSTLGAPERYSEWRDGQDRALSRVLHSKKRIIVIDAPTGIGKSLIGVLAGVFPGDRMIYLTATRGQQDQVEKDFREVGLVDIRGMGNYTCRGLDEGEFPVEMSQWKATHQHVLASGGRPKCDDGPCLDGARCSFRAAGAGCHYYEQYRRAQGAMSVVTNYAFWLHHKAGDDDLGGAAVLVCDEAHELERLISSFLRIKLDNWEVQEFAHFKWPKPDPGSIGEWSRWAVSLAGFIEGEVSTLGPGKRRRRLKDVLARVQKLAAAATDGGRWVSVKTRGGWEWEPIWPAPYVEEHLFRGIPKIVLMSATIRPKSMELLGIKKDDYEWVELPSPFPVERRLVSHVETVAMRHGMSTLQLAEWGMRIDQIIEGRLDRKGIIHTVSYQRAQELYRESAHRDIMLVHDSRSTKETIERFKAAEPPMVLVSPAIGTGVDFPFELCEFNVIGKLAFPDNRDPVMAARQAEDKEYPMYLAACALVQASGRGMRAADDMCETLVVDDQIKWFVWKFSHFLPKWWREAYRRGSTIPRPPKKINRQS